MPGPTREWATFTDPKDPRRPLLVDVTFLTSRWRCIFGCGCQGVLTEKAPELMQGCCSYGAHFSSKKDRDRTVRAARQLTDDEWQFAEVGRRRGVYARAGKAEWRTRLHQDACIFLNRPGFAGGAGCALHVHAMRTGVHHSDLKPEVCWQLPLCRIEGEDDDGNEVTRLTEFARSGWGGGGDDFAWWCVEAPEAFTGGARLYRSMERELRKMLGDELYEDIAAYLDARVAVRGAPPVLHPAEQRVVLRPKPSVNGSAPARRPSRPRAAR